MRPRIRFTPRGMSRWIPALVLLAALGVVAIPVSWSTTSDYADRAAAGEAWRDRGFTVAVVWPQNDAPDFVEGVKLAWSQVNGGSGPLAGKVRLRQFTEPLTRDEGGVAARVASDPSVMVVLGHAVPEHIVPASLVYERHSIVFSRRRRRTRGRPAMNSSTSSG